MTAPERIWADARTCTVYMDGSSPITARDREFRNSTEYTRSDLVAELAADNERLKHCSFLARVAAYFDASDLASSFMSEDGDGGFLAAIHRMTQEIVSLRAEALSRTGAVKATGLEWDKGVVDCARPLPGMRYVACSTTPAGSWAWWLDDAPETRAVFPSEAEAKAAAQADYERRILSALEPAAPEGQQPVAWRYRYNGQWYLSHDKHFAKDAFDLEPLYTRPSERAVTEAGIEAAERTMAAHYERPLKAWELTAIHEALKAAMKAGR